MPTFVRPFSETDFDDWLRLWRAYQGFYKAAIADEVRPGQLFTNVGSRRANVWSVCYRRAADLRVGALDIPRSNWTTGDYCYLQDLNVAEESPGGGIGRALIEHVYVEAQKAGCSRVYWLTHESNVTGMRLYDRVSERGGFVQYRKMF